MPRKLRLAGERFGRLTVIGESPNVGNKSAWKCRCDCGIEKIATACALRRGYTKSCGCLASDIAMEQKSKSVRNTRLYKCWTSIKQRCGNPKSPNYSRYGFRGVSVCDEWARSFEAFKGWAVANGYADNLEIDRIDNDGNYAPENCRWVTHKQNCQNRTASKHIKHHGERYSAEELANLNGIPPTTFREWIRLKGLEYALKRIDAPEGAESEGNDVHR